MKSKLIGLVIAGIVVVTIIATVGGWLDNDDGGKENPGNQGGSAPIVETDVDVMPLTEFNTDTPFENLTIEIVEYFGEHMIYKVTNNSNVCYKYISGTIYFKSEPLPERLPLSEGQEYYNPFGLSNIPAYSVTYHLEPAFCEEMSKDKGASFDGVVYYPFEFGVDPYRVEIEGISNSPFSSIISDVLLQDASENIYFDRSSFESSSNKLGTLKNKSNQIIKYDGFVVFTGGHAFEINSGNILPHDVTYDVVKGYSCTMDTSSFETEEDYKENCEAIIEKEVRKGIYQDIYADINELDDYTANKFFDIYINAWYVDEMEE